MAKRESGGFTLLELMIVVVIIAMLAGFAVFNYNKYGFRARRADGKEMLMRVASAQERYYSNFNKYAPDLTTLGLTSSLSEKGYYSVSTAYIGGDKSTYILTGTPQAPAQNGDVCKNLQINNAGQKTFTGNESNGVCWN